MYLPRYVHKYIYAERMNKIALHIQLSESKYLDSDKRKIYYNQNLDK